MKFISLYEYDFRSSCQNCTTSLCMWCKNLGMCVDRNAYLASFPYGQCMDWTTHTEECPKEEKENSKNITDLICSGYKTCDSCRGNPSCGWCDDGQGTGIGSCKLGGASNPLVEVKSGHRQAQWIAADTCSVSESKSWHFTSCPGNNFKKKKKTFFCKLYQKSFLFFLE